MGYNTTPLVFRAGVRPNFGPAERFTYRVTTASGNEFVLFDPVRNVREPAFDQVKLAAALATASGGSSMPLNSRSIRWIFRRMERTY